MSRREQTAGHRVVIAVALMTVLSLLGGCSLPGYRMDAGADSSWYGDTVEAAGHINYEPRVVLITPQLIHHMHEERVNTPIDPAVRALMQKETAHNYQVGPGDILQIIVFGQQELNNPMGTSSASNRVAGQLVSADGAIYYPYIGKLHVDGLTRSEIRRKITDGLSGYIREPQVEVRVRAFHSKRVFISGDIAKPCTVSLTNIPLTVLRALDKCGSLVSQNKEGPFGIQTVVLVRDGQATPLRLNELYRHGTTIPLQAGDRLIVDDSASRVFMVGEFQKQKALPYSTGGMTLGDAIADAGGLNLSSADAGNIYVVRGFMSEQHQPPAHGTLTLRPKVFHLDASSVNALILADNFRLEPRDVVFAAPASMVNFNRALALLAPSLNMLFRTFLIYDRANN